MPRLANPWLPIPAAQRFRNNPCAPRLQIPHGSGYPLRSLSLGDVDGDNKVDALLNSGWGLTVQKGNGLGGFTAQPTLNTGIAVNSAVMGDVNADGKLDLVAAGSQNSSHCTSYGYDPYWGYPYCNAWTYTNTPQASVLVGNGLGGFALPLTSSLAAESDGYCYLGDVVVADFMGDSRPELVTIDYYAGKAIVAANDGDWNPPPSIVISDAAIVTEGDSGSVNAVFTVSIVGSHHGLSVTYQTADSSATSGSDYTAQSGTLTFAAGVESMIGTIEDDDPTPTLTINDVSKNEGNNNLTSFVFTVTLSAASGQSVWVNFATANGTATTADGDYLFTSGTVHFSPGQTTATITVQVRGGRSKELNETFFVNLSGANNATISDGQGLGTILNDDNGKGPKSRR